eukprot:199445-Prymnesium_polylepis.2
MVGRDCTIRRGGRGALACETGGPVCRHERKLLLRRRQGHPPILRRCHARLHQVDQRVGSLRMRCSIPASFYGTEQSVLGLQQFIFHRVRSARVDAAVIVVKRCAHDRTAADGIDVGIAHVAFHRCTDDPSILAPRLIRRPVRQLCTHRHRAVDQPPRLD